MSWSFNPPPGWPPQPEGWVPPPGWAPDPRWPPAPAGWQFWVPGRDSAPAQAPPAEAPPPEAPPYAPAQAGPYPPAQAGPYPPVQGSYPAPAQGSYPAPAQGTYPAFQGSYPPVQAGPYGQAGSYPPGQAGSYPPGQAGSYPPPGQAAGSYPPPGEGGPFPPAGGSSRDDRQPTAADGRPWFTRWWVIAGLIALLAVGAAIGFGGTRAAIELRSDDVPATTDGAGGPGGGAGGDPGPAAQATPVAGQAPEPTASPRLALPTISPPAIDGIAGELCADVALIMITMVTATAEAEDFEAYLDSVVEARRTAADELRNLAEDPDNGPDRAAVEELAGEIDLSAQMVEDEPGNQGTFEDSFDRVSDAYQTFTDDNC